MDCAARRLRDLLNTVDESLPPAVQICDTILENKLQLLDCRTRRHLIWRVAIAGNTNQRSHEIPDVLALDCSLQPLVHGSTDEWPWIDLRETGEKSQYFEPAPQREQVRDHH